MSESVKTSKNFFSGFWWDIVRSFQVEILSNKLFISNNGIGKLILPLSGKIPPSISPQKFAYTIYDTKPPTQDLHPMQKAMRLIKREFPRYPHKTHCA